ncbi:MAG: CpaF family protein [Ilumatobacter sp.]|jgi:pilus assembly protein CpaF|uniref:CpaF family protein n=1 Tax=Ilumatobacter sp. TaxID=1967498 RepID=UPI003918B48E
MSAAPDAALVDLVCASVGHQHGDLERLVADEVRRRAPLATSDERARLHRSAVARMTGLSELDVLVSDPTIDEVIVNDTEIWVDRHGELRRVGTLHATSTEQLIERILAPIGRRVDRTSPIVDARLLDGARVCAVVPPVATTGALLSIRRFPNATRTLDEFTDDVGIEVLRNVVAAGCNAVVTGATSSGKTSLLAALLGEVDDDERIIVLEDTAELPCHAPHLVRMEARPASIDGLAAITLEQLVKTALRLRPDRLVVGEVRGDEVVALTQAMNTGHDGSFSTCHANSPLDALLRLESLVLRAAPQWPLAAIRQQISRSIDVVVHVERRGSQRRVTAIAEVSDEPADRDGSPSVRDLAVAGASGELVRRAELTRRRR